MERNSITSSQFVPNDGTKYGSMLVTVEDKGKQGNQKKIYRAVLNKKGGVKFWQTILTPVEVAYELEKYIGITN